MKLETKALTTMSIVLVAPCMIGHDAIASEVEQKPVANPTLAELPAGTWYAAQNMPSPGAQGSHAAAYSGFVVDNRRGLIIKRGGGHCDYKGTEVQQFDTANSLSWNIGRPSVSDTEYLGASHFDDDSFPGAVVELADGSAPEDFAKAVEDGLADPIARHTTNTTTFIESTGEFFMTGKFTYGESGGSNGGIVGCNSRNDLPYEWGPADTWTYNPDDRKWRYRAQHGIDMEWAGCAWVPQGAAVSSQLGAVFCVTEQTRDVYRYDVSSNTWSTVNRSMPTTGLGINLTYSSAFHSLYFYRDGNLWSYDIGNDSWTKVTASGSAGASNESNTAFDVVNNVVGVWDGNGLYFCEFSDALNCAWSSADRNGMPGGSGGGGVSGNFAYDSINNVFWAANAQSGTVYMGAYRFKEGEPPGPAPAPPTNLEARE